MRSNACFEDLLRLLLRIDLNQLFTPFFGLVDTLWYMRSQRLITFLIVIACLANGRRAGQSQLPTNEDPLHAVNDALFSSFLPVEDLKQDPRTFALLTSARDNMWSEANHAPGFRRLLSPFSDLRGLGTSCGIQAYLGSRGLESFASLTQSERDHVLLLLSSCDQNEPRRLAMSARAFYIAEAYGAIQERLSGVKLNLSASHTWIEEH